MLVTLQQAKKLKELGYDFDRCFCGGAMDCICEYLGDEHKLISIHEALEWFREVKGIECSVNLANHTYYGHFLRNGEYRMTNPFDTYSIAESALLDAIIKYLEK